MALFSRKPKVEETKPEAPIAVASRVQKTGAQQKHASKVLLSPRVTEKGAYLGSTGVYVFNVHKDANKREISEAVHAIFKVWPRMVRVARIPRKQAVTRGTNRMGKTAGGKKAYVYLKEGDTIEVI
jgi:large subunit ribosomal protein L23